MAFSCSSVACCLTDTLISMKMDGCQRSMHEQQQNAANVAVVIVAKTERFTLKEEETETRTEHNSPV